MSWSLKNSTLYFKSSELISDISPESREATPKLTLLSSAPMVHVRGSTRIEFCSAAGGTIDGAVGFGFTGARAIGFLRRWFWWAAFRFDAAVGSYCKQGRHDWPYGTQDLPFWDSRPAPACPCVKAFPSIE